jgi:hypothetical protein
MQVQGMSEHRFTQEDIGYSGIEPFDGTPSTTRSLLSAPAPDAATVGYSELAAYTRLQGATCAQNNKQLEKQTNRKINQ